MHPLTAEQARAMLEGVEGHRLGALFTVAVYTGLRQGELLALKWRDVDIAAGTLTMRGTLVRGTHEVAEPKTTRSRRLLCLAPGAVAVLRRHRGAIGNVLPLVATDDERFVFTSQDGTPLDSRNVTQDLQAVLVKLGLPRQRFHDLRHVYATLMIQAGEEMGTVSKALGHSNLSTTSDIYAHLNPAIGRRAASRIDSMLGQAASG